METSATLPHFIEQILNVQLSLTRETGSESTSGPVIYGAVNCGLAEKVHPDDIQHLSQVGAVGGKTGSVVDNMKV